MRDLQENEPRLIGDYHLCDIHQKKSNNICWPPETNSSGNTVVWIPATFITAKLHGKKKEYMGLTGTKDLGRAAGKMVRVAVVESEHAKYLDFGKVKVRSKHFPLDIAESSGYAVVNEELDVRAQRLAIEEICNKYHDEVYVAGEYEEPANQALLDQVGGVSAYRGTKLIMNVGTTQRPLEIPALWNPTPWTKKENNGDVLTRTTVELPAMNVRQYLVMKQSHFQELMTDAAEPEKFRVFDKCPLFDALFEVDDVLVDLKPREKFKGACVYVFLLSGGGMVINDSTVESKLSIVSVPCSDRYNTNASRFDLLQLALPMRFCDGSTDNDDGLRARTSMSDEHKLVVRQQHAIAEAMMKQYHLGSRKVLDISDEGREELARFIKIVDDGVMRWCLVVCPDNDAKRLEIPVLSTVDVEELKRIECNADEDERRQLLETLTEQALLDILGCRVVDPKFREPIAADGIVNNLVICTPIQFQSIILPWNQSTIRYMYSVDAGVVR